MSGDQRFEPDDAEEILRRAVQLDTSSNTLSRSELLKAAGELGIQPESVEAAITQLENDRATALQRAQDTELRREWKRYRYSKVIEDVRGAVGFCVLMIGIDFFMGGFRLSHPLSWSIWPVAFVGLVTLGKVIEYVFNLHGDSGFENWKRKRARRREREAAATE